ARQRQPRKRTRPAVFHIDGPPRHLQLEVGPPAGWRVSQPRLRALHLSRQIRSQPEIVGSAQAAKLALIIIPIPKTRVHQSTNPVGNSTLESKSWTAPCPPA